MCMYEDNIELAYRRAMDNKSRAGDAAEWYSGAKEYADNIAHLQEVSVEQVVAIIALMSPLTSWESQLKYIPIQVHAAKENLNNLTECQDSEMTKLPGPGTDVNKARAQKAFNSKDPLSHVRGTKTRPFALNIMGDYSKVTVDRHAATLAGVTRVPTKKDTRELTVAYTNVASKFGVKPAIMQAITWSFHRVYKKDNRW